MIKVTIFISLVFFWQAGFAQTESQKLSLAVTQNGFEPKLINAKPGVRTLLTVLRTTDRTCATQIVVIAKKKITKDLPLNKPIEVDLGILEKGNIRFACGMDMISGQILVN